MVDKPGTPVPRAGGTRYNVPRYISRTSSACRNKPPAISGDDQAGLLPYPHRQTPAGGNHRRPMFRHRRKPQPLA